MKRIDRAMWILMRLRRAAQDLVGGAGEPGPEVGRSEWVEIELFRGEKRIGAAHEQNVLGRSWLAFAELRRDGAFENGRLYAERKLFGMRYLTEDEARHEVMGPPWSEACAMFKQPSCFPGRCATCGNDEGEHAAAATRRAASARHEDARSKIAAVFSTSGWRVQAEWTSVIAPPNRETWFPDAEARIRRVRFDDPHRGNLRDMTQEEWSKLAEYGLPMALWEDAVKTWVTCAPIFGEIEDAEPGNEDPDEARLEAEKDVARLNLRTKAQVIEGRDG